MDDCFFIALVMNTSSLKLDYFFTTDLWKSSLAVLSSLSHFYPLQSNHIEKIIYLNLPYLSLENKELFTCLWGMPKLVFFMSKPVLVKTCLYS